MGILALYDIKGIQEYIFSSDKLKENLGASLIVEELLQNDLVDSIREEVPGAQCEWEKATCFAMNSSSPPKAEVIYIGGGNAMVAYLDESLYKNVNKALSKKVLGKAEGLIKVVAASILTDYKSFSTDQHELYRVMNREKASHLQSMPLMGISITREGASDGLPAQIIDEREYISRPAYEKRKRAKSDRFSELIEHTKRNRYRFPDEFNDLTERGVENFIAVVHIDGNNMGKKLESLLKDEKSYDNAVSIMRNFALDINSVYQDTMKDLIKKLMEKMQKQNGNETEGKCFLPLRPLVLNGDDVTFVTRGKLGLACAAYFLRALSGKSTADGAALSACAGVAIVKSHFPFYRAYELAEALCQSAKTKGKIIACQTSKDMASWIDYHIVYSGVTTELDQLRTHHYNIPSQPPLKALIYEEAGKPVITQNCYHLLWRPWCISGETENPYQWEHLTDIIKKFREEDECGNDKWPRSKIKGLRNAMISSQENVDVYLKELESRDLILPPFNGGNSQVFIIQDGSIQTPYFDAIDLLDFYDDIE